MKQTNFENSNMRASVLIVDSMADSLDSYVRIKDALQQLRIRVLVTGSGAEAMDHLYWLQPQSLLVIDTILIDMSGLELATKIKHQSAVPILMTGYQTESHIIAGLLDLVADDFVRKPVDPRELAARIHCLLNRTNRAALRQTKGSKAQTGRMILHHDQIKSM